MTRNGSTQRHKSGRRFTPLAAVVVAVFLGAACAQPGAVDTPVPSQSVAAPSGSGTPSTQPSASTATRPDCGTEPVELNAVFETGFPTVPALADEFSKQYPNVTFKVTQDQFANLINSTPRLLSSDNPPDLIRLPTLISLVKDELLKNLDEYATAYGWDKWPAAALAPSRVDTSNFTRGSGSLYAAGLNNSLTGVFYDKRLAEQIGMTAPPTTVEEFEALLAKAKAAKLLPIMAWNDSQSGGGLAFPLQQLMAAYGPTQPINDWVFQKPGASIDTASNLQAAQHLQQWIEAGYFPKDVNAIGYTAANARFGKGEGVFMFNGDWQNGGYDKDLAGNIGFFAFPSSQGGTAGMSSPLTFGIAANAKHADCAAFFFDWVATNETARQINVKGFGSNPGGPADLAIPPVAEGSVTNDTLAAGSQVAKSNGLMDFIANATGAIFLGPEGWTPNLQKMVGGKLDAAGLLKAVQAEYEKELAEQQ